MLTLTPKAIARIQDLFKNDETAKGKALRVAMKPAGCNGFKYDFAFDARKPEDKSYPQPGFEVIVDPESMQKVEEATIDYFEDATSSEFRVTNPKEKSTCACGESKAF